MARPGHLHADRPDGQLRRRVVREQRRRAPVALVGRELDAVVLTALMKNPDDRFQTARDMALAIEHVVKMSTPSAVGTWVESLASDMLAGRADRIAEIESRSDVFAALKSRGTPFAPWVPDAPPSHPSQAQPLPAVPPLSNPQPLVPADLRPSRAKVAIVLAGLGGLVLLAIVLFAFAGGGDEKKAVTPTATTTATATATAIATSTAAAPVTGTTPPTTASATATAKKPATILKPAADRCSPPYTVDAQGVKHPKPECL